MSSSVFYYSNNTSETSNDASLTRNSYNVPSGYQLTSVTVGNTVTELSNSCFLDCSSLSSITFDSNNSVISLGTLCFQNCSSLTSITIPESVISLGSSCFQNCSSLTSITFLTVSITSLDNNTFAG